MIPDSILNQIQERTDIVELIAQYVPLRRAGRSFKANCPFHNEKTPSFVVNPDKQIFHCFGCNVGGNVFGFVMKIEKKDFREVVEQLADRCGMELPKDKPVDSEASRRTELFAKANRMASDFFRKTLLESREAENARAYLKSRGIDDATAEEFKIGFAPDAWDALLKVLKPEVQDALLERTGLFLTRKEGNGHYDRFRNRVMFPILDSKGVCVAFGGRVMDDSTPKYMNSPETEAYVKGRHLYGMFQGRKAIREGDQAIVVEGYMDLIACHQAGVQNVTASCGTALTTEQARLIRRSTNNVVMLYDADKAGEAATLRGLEIFLEEGMDVKIVRLPEGHDPDSYVRACGAGRFRSELSGSKTLFEYKLSLLKSRYGTTTLEGKVKVANEMVALFQKVKNEILRSAWLRELSKELSLPEEALAAEMRKGPREAGPRAPEAQGEPATPIEVPLIEKQILGVLLELPALAATAREELRDEDFKHPLMRKIVMQLFEIGEPVTAARLITLYQEEPDAARVISLACAEADILADKKKAFADCVAVMKRSRFKNRLTSLRIEMQEAERAGDMSRRDQLMRDFNELNRGMRQIDEKK